MKRLGILASGAGSNFQALAEACQRGAIPAEVALLVVNVPGAGALSRAARLGVPAVTLDHKGFATREAFEKAVVEQLRDASVDLVCLAGFMRLVGPTLLSAFPERVLNIHPSLLPAFPGLNAVRQALEHGVAVTGCTVHLVDAGTDTGPILLQAAVPVRPGDTEALLAARVHAQEHVIYPAAVRLWAEGRVRVQGRVARIDAPGAEGTLVGPVRVG